MKYTHLYRTCIQKTLSEDQIDIMSAFKTALRNDPGLEVQLINYYKGMPLSFNATVAGVGRDELELRVNPRQAVAISDDNYTFIRSKIFKHDIVVKARQVNIKEKAVALYHPCYVEIGAERRNHIRLRVHPPIDAQYLTPEGKVRGELIELSTAGTIMVVDHTVDIDTWGDGKLSFQLPDADNINTSCDIKVPARFITALEDGSLPRFIFGFTSDKTSERHIAKFLFNRQIEIMRMLRDGFDIG